MAQVGWKGRAGAELSGRAQERDRTEMKGRNRMGVGGGSMRNNCRTEGKDSNRTEEKRTRETNRKEGEGKSSKKKYWGKVA